MTNERVLYREDDGIAWVTLNRPAARNALNPALLTELATVLDHVRTDDAVQALVMTGAGSDAFSAGADIRFLHEAAPLEVRGVAQQAVSITHTLETLGKVTVAALNGHALGGGLELAEACTLRVAVEGTRLGHPEVRIGAVAGFGGTTRLPRLIGRGRAAELLLTGDTIDAEKAQRIGLVNRVVAPGQLHAEVEGLVGRILAQAPIAVRLTWEALHRGSNLTLEESAALGADYFGLAAATDDFRTGTRAFLDKAEPVFEGT